MDKNTGKLGRMVKWTCSGGLYIFWASFIWHTTLDLACGHQLKQTLSPSMEAFISRPHTSRQIKSSIEFLVKTPVLHFAIQFEMAVWSLWTERLSKIGAADQYMSQCGSPPNRLQPETRALLMTFLISHQSNVYWTCPDSLIRYKAPRSRF